MSFFVFVAWLVTAIVAGVLAVSLIVTLVGALNGDNVQGAAETVFVCMIALLLIGAGYRLGRYYADPYRSPDTKEQLSDG